MGATISDCVAMKDRIQARLLAEYERRKDEFPPYVASIYAAAERRSVRMLRAGQARTWHGRKGTAWK